MAFLAVATSERGPGAVIFDCDGVIADSEPLHLGVFQEILRPLGITITSEQYVQRYLGFDDRGVFGEVLRDHGRSASESEVAALVAAKAERFEKVLAAEVTIYPGVVELVRGLAGVPLAVASGALRHEVELILSRAGISEAFAAIIGADDVHAGKPDPETFVAARAALGEAVGRTIPAAACLVIEDSIAGIEAAKRAGMRCLAVTNSYPARQLVGADLVVATLAGLGVDRVRALFG